MKIISSFTPLTFGKYFGMTPNHILSFDPHYILWLANSTAYNVSPKLIRKATRAVHVPLSAPMIVNHYHLPGSNTVNVHRQYL